MRQSVGLGRVAGIPVGVHWTVAVILVIIAEILGASVLPAALPHQPAVVYWAAAAAAALVFAGDGYEGASMARIATQAGVSNLHGTDLWDSPVILTSSRGAVAATGIAEYVIAGAYYFARGLHEATRQKAAGELSRGGYALRALTGATIGIVGLGGIGAEVARLARAAGMQVVATRRSVASPQRDAEGVDLLLPAGKVAELAAASDFVAVCVQLTPATEQLIGAEVLAAMKPHAVVINIARGEVIDEDALIAALQAGRIAGAVLDVYAGELAGRPPRRELVELPQVVLTPHVSGTGDPNGPEPAKRLFAENLRRYLEGQPLVNLVDRSRGY